MDTKNDIKYLLTKPGHKSVAGVSSNKALYKVIVITDKMILVL